MTVVAYRNGQMTADSALSDGVLKGPAAWKIARHEQTGALCGVAGVAAVCMSFLGKFRKYGLPADSRGAFDFDLDDGSIGLIASKTGQLYLVESRVIYPVEAEYWAIGSGGVYAIAAMKAGLGTIRAVKIAIELDPQCGGPTRSLRHDKKSASTE